MLIDDFTDLDDQRKIVRAIITFQMEKSNRVLCKN